MERLADDASPSTRARMESQFEMVIRYELAFWEMAYRGPRWPGDDNE